MSITKAKKDSLNTEEWKELIALKEAITERPQSVVPEQLEKFTEYFVRSLREKGG